MSNVTPAKHQHIVTVREMAEFFGFHEQTLYKWKKARPRVFQALLEWYLAFKAPNIPTKNVEVVDNAQGA